MGKRTRRRTGRRRGNSKKNGQAVVGNGSGSGGDNFFSREGGRRRPAVTATAATNEGSSSRTTTTEPKEEGSAASLLVRRIRHAGSPSTRAAALAAALRDGRFSRGGGGGSGEEKRRCSPALLSAVRDQFVLGGGGGRSGADDGDNVLLLLCSSTAAACLAEYAAGSGDRRREDRELCAGWLPLFVGRLGEELQLLLRQQQQQQGSTSPTRSTFAARAGLLARPCLRGVAALLENNPLAMDRLVRDAQLRRGTMEVLTAWLEQTLPPLQPTAATTTEEEKRQRQERRQNNDDINDIRLLAARCLHTALEDNGALLHPWATAAAAATGSAVGTEEAAAGIGRTLRVLLRCIHHRGSGGGDDSGDDERTVRLHCLGALMSVWIFLVLDCPEEESLRQLHAVLVAGSNYVPGKEGLLRLAVTWLRTILVPTLDRTASTVAAADQPREAKDAARCWHLLVRNVREAEERLRRERSDEAMERQVLRRQRARGESARSIARRLCRGHDEGGEVNAAANADIIMEDEEEVQNQKSGRLQEDRQDSLELLQEAQEKWEEAIRPRQLALELAAYLTSPLPANEDDDEDEVMEEEDGDVPSSLKLRPEVIQIVLDSGLPDAIHRFLGQVLGSDWYCGGNDNNDNKTPPQIVLESISDLQARAAVCLGNCVSYVPRWQPPDGTWNDLVRAAAPQTSDHQAPRREAREALSYAAVAALRSRPSLAARPIRADQLDMVLRLLQPDCSACVKRDAVTMLGLLLAGREHSAAVNRKVCQALLQVNETSENRADLSMVLAEILNVLMDIYGDDDCHPDVFLELFPVHGAPLNALKYFQSTQPALKELLSLLGASRDDSVTDEDLEYWRETALNAARFIQYKQGYASS